MLRRSFLGAVASVVITPFVSANTNVEKITLLKAENFIWDNTKGVWLIDPFIKIYTSQDKVVKYKEHTFKQKENYILHYITNNQKTDLCCYIPIDIKEHQRTKGSMITEVSKFRFNYECFELIADNGKSNLYAICDNDKFQANLKGNGKDQCSMLKS